MGLSKKTLKWFIPAIAIPVLSGIVVPTILQWRKGADNIPTQPVTVGKIEAKGGDVITGGNITIQKGLTREEAEEVAKKVFEEEFQKRGQPSPPVSTEELLREVESLRGSISEEKLKRARLLFERGDGEA